MTTLAGADIRGFYTALGIELPRWADQNASVRCFAAPEAHNSDDRSPSASVSVITGAWLCHACGAHGGAYDAALAVGHTPRSAIELMIGHGLTERRDQHGIATRPKLLRAHAPTVPARVRRPPAASEADISRWERSLARRQALISQLADERGWSYPALRARQAGLDAGGRLTIPIRNRAGELRGILRYDPWRRLEPKLLCVRGTRLGLIPHPALETDDHVLLVEGVSDMLAARSRGLPAIAVPGATSWQPRWANLLIGKHVTVVMDCDPPGRECARRIARDLTGRAHIRVVELDPTRDDRYDLSDALLERPNETLALVRRDEWRGQMPPRSGRDRGTER